MARYYPASATAAPYTPATFHGAWDDTASADTKKLRTDKTGTQTSNPVSETSASNTWDACVARFVSDGLAAGTISGTVDFCFGARDGGTAMAASYHVHLWVTQGDSDTARGTLIADYVEAASAEWTGVTAQVGQRPVAPIAVTPVTVQAGDRLVLEIGYRANNTITSTATGRLYYGGSGSGGDMDNGDASTTKAAWIDVPDPVSAATSRGQAIWVG